MQVRAGLQEEVILTLVAWREGGEGVVERDSNVHFILFLTWATITVGIVATLQEVKGLIAMETCYAWASGKTATASGVVFILQASCRGQRADWVRGWPLTYPLEHTLFI